MVHPALQFAAPVRRSAAWRARCGRASGDGKHSSTGSKPRRPGVVPSFPAAPFLVLDSRRCTQAYCCEAVRGVRACSEV